MTVSDNNLIEREEAIKLLTEVCCRYQIFVSEEKLTKLFSERWNTLRILAHSISHGPVSIPSINTEAVADPRIDDQ